MLGTKRKASSVLHNVKGHVMEAVAHEESQVVKISSKRQITIPAKLYREMGFKDYAALRWTKDGLLIQPLKVEDDDDLTESILRYLIEQGYEGEELIEQYKIVKPQMVSLARKVDEAEADIAAGRVQPWDEFRDEVRERYGF